jgi:hypothetical protein
MPGNNESQNKATPSEEVMKPKVTTPRVTYFSSLSFLLSLLHIPGNTLLFWQRYEIRASF